MKPLIPTEKVRSIALDDLARLNSEQYFVNINGLIASSYKSKEWVHYKHVFGYEDLGKIVDYYRLGNVQIVHFTKGFVLKNNNVEHRFDKSVNDRLIIHKDEILGVVSTPDRFEHFIFRWQSQHKKHVLKEVQNHLEGINSVRFHDQSFWVANTFFSESDYIEFFKINLDGSVSKIEDIVYDSFEVTSAVMELIGGKLIIMLSNGEIYTKEGQGFRKVKTIDENILYSLQKVVKYNDHLFILTNGNQIYEVFSEKLVFKELQVLSGFNFQDHFIDFHINEKGLSLLDMWNNAVIRIEFKNTHEYLVESVSNYSNLHRSSKLVEDENEIWILSARNELYKIDKCDSSIKTFTEFVPLLTEGLRAGQISLNEDFVIVMLEGYENRIQEYILYHRAAGVFERKSADNVEEFFFRVENGLLCDYKGNTIVGAERLNFYSLVSRYQNTWNKLLFLYHLPLSGTDKNANKILRTDNCTYRHIRFSEENKGYYDGILIHNNKENALKYYAFRDQLRNFRTQSDLFTISGDSGKLWLTSGGSAFFSFNEETGIIRTDFEWEQIVSHPVFIGQTEQYLIIGDDNKKVLVIDQVSQSSKVLAGIDDFPVSFTSVNNKYFIASHSRLLLYDQHFNYIGPVLHQSAEIIKTDYNSYVKSGAGWHVLN